MAKKQATDCPLKLHRNGQWYRKVKGIYFYFGRDKEQALSDWAEGRDYYLAGRRPPRRDGSPSLSGLANLFAARCRQRVSSGELAERSGTDYVETIGRMVGILGRECRVEHLKPMDYASLKEKLAEPVSRSGDKPGRTVARRSPVTVSGDVRRIRAFLRWAADTELISPPRFGREFSPANQKALRRQRAIKGRQDLTADEIRRIVDSTSAGPVAGHYRSSYRASPSSR